MLSPLKIHFPPELCKNLQITHTCPPEFKYSISFAECNRTRCDLGDFIIQSIAGDDYWIELWTFAVKEEGHLDIVVNEPSICIALFLKGNLVGHLLGHGKVNTLANTYNIFYLPTGTHKVSLRSEDYTLLYIILPKNFLKGMAVEHSQMQEIVTRLSKRVEIGTLLTSFPLPHSVWRILKRMERLHKKGAALDFALRQYILEILALYNEQYKLGSPASRVYLSAREKSFAVREYILSNLGDTKLGGLNQLASDFHISPKTLTKQFKSLTGKTVPQFINDERLEWARRLLNDKKLPVFEVTQLVGFSDTANFIRRFKKKFGISPGGHHRRKK